MGTTLFGTLLLYFLAPLAVTVALWAVLLYVELFWWLVKLPFRSGRAAWRMIGAASSGGASPRPTHP
jgi:hypothetical protein